MLSESGFRGRMSYNVSCIAIPVLGRILFLGDCHMKSTTTTADNKLTNEQLGGLYRRVSEIIGRLGEGMLNYERVMSELQKLLEDHSGGGQHYQWAAWKTINLGTGPRTADDFRRALAEKGCKLGEWGNDIIGKLAFSARSDEAEIKLVRITVAELGYVQGASRKDIYEQALKLGLDLCPSEVAPQLRLQYTDQPKGEVLIIAMEPITDSGGNLHVFNLGCDANGLWLNADVGNPGGHLNATRQFVFVNRK
jgi:hypothetical protein